MPVALVMCSLTVGSWEEDTDGVFVEKDGSDAGFRRVAELEGVSGCRRRLIAGASLSRGRRWTSVQREGQERCRNQDDRGFATAGCLLRHHLVGWRIQSAFL